MSILKTCKNSFVIRELTKVQKKYFNIVVIQYYYVMHILIYIFGVFETTYK